MLNCISTQSGKRSELSDQFDILNIIISHYYHCIENYNVPCQMQINVSFFGLRFANTEN